MDKDFQENLHKFLNEYMCGQWPSGIGSSKVISNISPELGKKLCSPQVIRCYLLPELFKESVLIPTQNHLQELTENGSSDPLDSFIDLWRPLLQWIREKSKHFFSELLNFVLSYLERYPMNHFKIKFLNRLLIRVLRDVQPSSRNKVLEEKLLHYCLQNPTPETLTIVGLLNIDENQLVQLKNLWKVVEPFNDIIFSEKLTKGKGTCDNDEKELSRYFSKYPIQDCGLQLEHQVDATYFGDGAMLKSWSLTESDLNKVKAGSVLANLNETERTLNVLPDAINAYVPAKKPIRHSQEEIDMLDADESTGQVAENGLLKNDYDVSIF
ncbi:uncharacterized protein LOC135689821 [Rhopilema esculentum]|uniref:uncharacterized protein LOC135689821 n=1 Tax=Rhopilema esculentum TaxID=499914 RepID=UPI0031E194C7